MAKKKVKKAPAKQGKEKVDTPIKVITPTKVFLAETKRVTDRVEAIEESVRVVLKRTDLDDLQKYNKALDVAHCANREYVTLTGGPIKMAKLVD